MAGTATARKKSPRRQARSLRTREAILECAVDIASVRGLEGLTVGELAKELRMSKSGLFAHFGSKEELQLATVEAARQIFVERVAKPALVEPKGILRLWSLIDRWVSHVQNRVFAGGCFFTAASFEFDSRKGPVRDRIAAVMREWLGVLARAIEEAKKAGHIAAGVDPTRLAHEIHSLAVGAHWAHQLLDDRQAYARARTTMLEKLRGIATPSAPPLS
jgi:AcrR family transcriptional regulator